MISDKQQLIGWWREKGAAIANRRTIDLIGQRIGKVPLENLFTREELSEIDRNNLYMLEETLQKDGMNTGERSYQDGSIELFFIIE